MCNFEQFWIVEWTEFRIVLSPTLLDDGKLQAKWWVKIKLTKLAPQFLLNFSCYKHAGRLGHNSFERFDP